MVQYQYVVDPCAKRLIDSGIKPEAIEDAYCLAEDVERRVQLSQTGVGLTQFVLQVGNVVFAVIVGVTP